MVSLLRQLKYAYIVVFFVCLSPVARVERLDAIDQPRGSLYDCVLDRDDCGLDFLQKGRCWSLVPIQPLESFDTWSGNHFVLG